MEKTPAPPQRSRGKSDASELARLRKENQELKERMNQSFRLHLAWAIGNSKDTLAPLVQRLEFLHNTHLYSSDDAEHYASVLKETKSIMSEISLIATDVVSRLNATGRIHRKENST